MPTITLKNISIVKLGGKRPGESFKVETDDAGIVLDPYWRARIKEDEISKARGEPLALEVVDPPAAPAPAAPATSHPVAASPSPTKTKKV